jgi:hypothetical protein
VSQVVLMLFTPGIKMPVIRGILCRFIILQLTRTSIQCFADELHTDDVRHKLQAAIVTTLTLDELQPSDEQQMPRLQFLRTVSSYCCLSITILIISCLH